MSENTGLGRESQIRLLQRPIDYLPPNEDQTINDLSPEQILSLAEMVDMEGTLSESDVGWMDRWLWNH